MAEHKVSAGTMLLFIDPLGGTKYDTIVCLKSVGITDSVNPIDASSWCGKKVLPGILNTSINFDGFLLQDPITDTLSGTNLRQTLRDKHLISWKIAPETPQPGDEIQTGFGFISELSSSYRFDSMGDFSGSIQVKGDITNQIVAPSGNYFSMNIDTNNVDLGFQSYIYFEISGDENFSFTANFDNGNAYYYTGASYYFVNQYYNAKSEYNPIFTFDNDDISKVKQLIVNDDPSTYASIVNININYLININILKLNGVIMNTINLSYNINLIELWTNSQTIGFINIDNNNSLIVLYFYVCDILTSSNINYYLNKLVQFNNYDGFVKIQSFGNPPTGQGLIDKNTLQLRRWTVLTAF